LSSPLARVAVQILKYLEQRPNAKDTALGIAGWWVHQPLDLVEDALALLVTLGFITNMTVNGTVKVFAAVQDKREEMRAWRKRFEWGEAVGDFTAISATSHTLRTLLETYITNETNSPLAGTPVDLRTPQELRAAGIRNAVSLWCYRVVRCAEVLNRPETRIPPDRVRYRPFPLELHYLITPLATAAADEQTLMGRVLQVLHDYAIVRGATIPASVVTQLPAELRVNFEPMTLEELTRVWHALKADYQLSVSYQVQLVEIDSMRDPRRAAPVLERDAEVVQAVG
jgi:hypothetical protein